MKGIPPIAPYLLDRSVVIPMLKHHVLLFLTFKFSTVKQCRHQQSLTRPTYSALAADRAGDEPTYQWTKDNCAMCQRVGPWRALDKTLHRSGYWGSVVHRLLHGTVGPRRASRISVNINADASLAALREFMVYSDDGR